MPPAFVELHPAEVQLLVFGAIRGTLGSLPTAMEKTASHKFPFTLGEWEQEGRKLCGVHGLDIKTDAVTLLKSKLRYFPQES